MKIGIVLSGPPAYSETFFRNKITFLKEAGYEVTLFVENKHTSFDLCKTIVGFKLGNGMPHDILSLLIALFRLSISPISALRLFSLNRKDHFSLKQNLRSLFISAHILNASVDWLHFGFATLTLGRENLAKATNSKMAVSIRGYDIVVYPLKHPGCYALLWQRLDILHYISDNLLILAKQNGFNAQQTRAVKITPAIDTRNFTPTPKTHHPKIIITTIARLHWIKGLEYTLEALALLKNEGIDFEYHIIGEGDERERLLFAAHQFGIAGQVRFHGKVPHIEIPSILNETDLYIQYSINEGFGNSVLEAQAMGCLCIVSDADGLSENIIHNQTGFVVKRRRPELLCKAIQHSLSLDKDTKRAITTAAMNRVKQAFDLETQKQSFLNLYSTGKK